MVTCTTPYVYVTTVGSALTAGKNSTNTATKSGTASVAAKKKYQKLLGHTHSFGAFMIRVVETSGVSAPAIFCAQKIERAICRFLQIFVESDSLPSALGQTHHKTLDTVAR